MTRRTKWIVLTACVLPTMVLLGFVTMAWWTATHQPAFPKCPTNLRQLGQALQLYAADHQKHLPETLEDLLRDYDITPEVYICQSSNGEIAPGKNADEEIEAMRARGLPSGLDDKMDLPPRHCTYIYAGRGLTSDQLTPKTVLIYEPLINHDNNGMNVLFGDGHVEFINRLEAPALVAAIAPSPTLSPFRTTTRQSP